MNHVEHRPFLDPPTDLLLPLLSSFLLHALFVWLFAGSFSQAPGSSPPFDVEILKPEEARQRARAEQALSPPPLAPPAVEEPPVARSDNQIVAPPDSPEAIPDRTRLLSDRNSRTDEEMVKRGEPAPPAEPPRAPAARTNRSQQDSTPLAPGGRSRPAPSLRMHDLPGLESLFANPSDLLRDPRIVSPKGPAVSRGSEERDYAAVARPELWADPGERGTPDYLPDVRNGRFTLLNTKADLFAPFVRRVGLRVFQSFSMDFKRRIFAGNVPQGQERIEIEAIMSRDGRRVEVVLRSRNGNLATDRVLLAALTDNIFFDENPPAKAVAEDGRIHFIFALDSSVWYGRDDGGSMRPGAQWLFGAGLL